MATATADEASQALDGACHSLAGGRGVLVMVNCWSRESLRSDRNVEARRSARRCGEDIVRGRSRISFLHLRIEKLLPPGHVGRGTIPGQWGSNCLEINATGSILGPAGCMRAPKAMPLFYQYTGDRGDWNWAGRVGKMTAKLSGGCRKPFGPLFLKRAV